MNKEEQKTIVHTEESKLKRISRIFFILDNILCVIVEMGLMAMVISGKFKPSDLQNVMFAMFFTFFGYFLSVPDVTAFLKKINAGYYKLLRQENSSFAKFNNQIITASPIIVFFILTFYIIGLISLHI